MAPLANIAPGAQQRPGGRGVQRGPGAQGGSREKSGAKGTARPEPLDFSDLLPSDIDRLIERTNTQLRGRPAQEKHQHFIREVERFRQDRDQPAGLGTVQPDYVGPFYEAMGKGPRDWDSYVSADTSKRAEEILGAGVDSGYLDHLTISGGDYLRHLTGSGNRISYHGYAGQPGHGGELLHDLKGQGLDVPYEVTHAATITHAPEGSTYDPHVKVKDGRGRALLYAINFQPRGPEEAQALLDTLAKHGGGEAKKIPGAWKHPEIRVGFPHESLEQQFVNAEEVGDQHISFLKDEPTAGFRAHEVYRHPKKAPGMAEKSLPVLAFDNPLKAPLTLSSGVSRGVSSPRTLALLPMERIGATLRAKADDLPQPDFLVPGAVVGRPGLALKALALAEHVGALSDESQRRLGQYLGLVRRCLKACGRVHDLPSLTDLVVTLGPRSRVPGLLSLHPGDLGSMAHHLGLTSLPLMKACPTAAGRFGWDLAAVAYDDYVARRTGWARETLRRDEAAALQGPLLDQLAPYNVRRTVNLVLGGRP